MLKRLIWNSHTRQFVLKILQILHVKKKTVMCLCWEGTKYGCNPKAITDALLSNPECDFNVWYAFHDCTRFDSVVPEYINIVEIGSLEYYYRLATANFIISNTRIGGGLWWPFNKKKGQYYIQTMHGGHGLKRQELEVCDSLPKEYLKLLYEDASRIDLMLSDSAFWTKLARTIFAYPVGEILECGLPRNDVFFRNDFISQKKKELVEIICSKKNFISQTDNIKFLVYCPTFRNNGRRDVYGFDVSEVLTSFEKKFGGIWFLLISSHPNMLSYYQEIYDFENPRVVDIGHEDLQSILIASDAAITDYSSAGFEFALTEKPVFLLIRDLEEYDRGIYFHPKDLPFPYASSDDELCDKILYFDSKRYIEELKKFNTNIIGLHESGHASECVVDWIYRKLKS